VSIFISIASYCDPILRYTLDRALAQARHPDALHFGIVDQRPVEMPRFVLQGVGARMSYVRIDPLDARGPCWARAIAMSLYDGEDWFFQIDSHMDFDEGWDAKLVAQAEALMPGRRGVALSAYPHPFDLVDGKATYNPTTSGVLAQVVKPKEVFHEDHHVLGFEAHPVDTKEALPGFHVGAGCLFTNGSFALEMPYDPWLYFHGEEQAVALRLFTHGWDVFHMSGLPVYHLYNTGQGTRPMHWDAGQDQKRATSWWSLEQRSRKRLSALALGEPLGIYGLGCVRSVADYADFSGIDYSTRTIAAKAYRPIVP
jgi:hypothetical protein